LVFLALKGNRDICTFTLHYRILELKRATKFAVAIVGIVKTIERAIEKRSHNQRSKTEIINYVKRLSATTFAIAKLED
jgi:hypothetical protein